MAHMSAKEAASMNFWHGAAVGFCIGWITMGLTALALMLWAGLV